MSRYWSLGETIKHDADSGTFSVGTWEFKASPNNTTDSNSNQRLEDSQHGLGRAALLAELKRALKHRSRDTRSGGSMPRWAHASSSSPARRGPSPHQK